MHEPSRAFDPSRFKLVKPKTNRKQDEFGDALKDWFGKPLYWVPKKFGRARTERIFDIMVKAGDNNFVHFMNKLHHD